MGVLSYLYCRHEILDPFSSMGRDVIYGRSLRWSIVERLGIRFVVIIFDSQFGICIWQP